MSKANYELVTDQLNELGFSLPSNALSVLEESIEKGIPDFQLSTEAGFHPDSTIYAILYFSRKSTDGSYRVEKFDATLRDNNDPASECSYTFLLYRLDITFLQAFNLLAGRAVHTHLRDMDGSTYAAWIQFDFKRRDEGRKQVTLREFKQSYGYYVDKVLNTYPIEELKDQGTKMAIIRSLEMGNRSLATFVTRKNKVEQLYIEASPAFRLIKIYSPKTEAYLKMVKR